MELKIYNDKDVAILVKHRDGEIRLGEKVGVLRSTNFSELEKNLYSSSCRYVLLGLPEDIGVRANFGRGGAYSSWNPTLSTILNIQSNRFLSGEEILVLGYVDFQSEMDAVKDINFQDSKMLIYAREIVASIDDFVAPIISMIVKAGKEPIIIGGGHNNAYPNIKGAAQGLFQSGKSKLPRINCINCDAHADLRPLEGRHSGNAFSYALNDGFLNKYAMIGLHEIFNTHSVIEFIAADDRLQASFLEDIFIKSEHDFSVSIRNAIIFMEREFVGLEIDLDAIQNIPSSAKTSSGISTIQARQYVHLVAMNCNVVYFHIAEAAPVLSHIKTDLKTGKLIAYLITDYIKARNSKHQSKS